MRRRLPGSLPKTNRAAQNIQVTGLEVMFLWQGQASAWISTKKKLINQKEYALCLPSPSAALTGHPGFLQAFANTRILFCQLACSDMLLKWYKKTWTSTGGVAAHGAIPEACQAGLCIFHSHVLCPLPSRVLLEPGGKYYYMPHHPLTPFYRSNWAWGVFSY